MPRPEHPFDRQLRSVPDRPGLERRLREAVVDDEALDHWLQEVVPPAGFHDRLLDAVLGELIDSTLAQAPGEEAFADRLLSGVLSDELLDESLRDAPEIAVDGAASRLEGLLTGVVDEALDEALRDTPPTAAPAAAIVSRASTESNRPGRRRGVKRRRLRGWPSTAAAAALMAVMLGLHWTALYRVAASMIPSGRSSETLLVVDQGPLELRGASSDDVRLETADQFVATTVSEPPPATLELIDWELPSAHGAYRQLALAISDGLDLGEDVLSARIEHVGYPSRGDQPPPVVERVRHEPAGASPPLDRAYDRAFHWRHGVSPWVAAEALPETPLPLAARPAEFDHALWLLSQGRSPREDEIRVEDALATLDPGFAMPVDGELAIRTAAGPSAFGELGAGLLQLGVAAGAPRGRLPSPVRLTVLLDLSKETGPIDHLALQRELWTAMRVMRPDDRLTVIALQQQPLTICQDASPADFRQVRQVLDQIQPQGLADWGRALPPALLAAGEGAEPGMRQELVILSSGRAEWSAAAEPLMDEALAHARDRGVTVRVAALRQPADSRLQSWAQRRQLALSEGVRAAGDSLIGAMCGQDATIAQDVRLTLKFDPQAVAAYRVIGSDGLPSQWSEQPDPIELRAGQQRTTLIELRWQDSQRSAVGVAELSWQDPEGTPQRRRQRVSRLQFAPSFRQSPPSLQAATLLAEAAQVLASSPFARGRGHSTEAVAELAWESAREVRGSEPIGRLRRAISAGHSEPWDVDSPPTPSAERADGDLNNHRN